MRYVVYDIETLKNCITFCFLDYESKKKKSFVLFDDIEQFYELVKFLHRIKNNNYWLVGFNCNAFDNQIIEELFKIYSESRTKSYSIEDIIFRIYEKSQYIIHLEDSEKYKQLIPEWRFTIPHVDLYKQQHYDRPLKATSLKWLQFTMRCANVQEMPINHDSVVSKEDISSILEYNWNDVESTAEFFERIMFETDLRLTLSEKYQLQLINSSEPKIVRDIFAKLLSEATKIPIKEIKSKKSHRKNVVIKDIIFPYIHFESEIGNEILNWFKNLDVEIDSIGTGLDGLLSKKYSKKFRFAQCDSIVALGGVHGCIDSGRYDTNDNWVIRDLDVVSFYPNLAIQNGIRPEHLGEAFNIIYNDIFEQRIRIPKSDPMNYIFKIILNSAYGLSKEKNTYFYDPKFTYSITVNGQLTLLMLAEQLLLQIPDIVFYQINTDGVSVGYDPIYSDKVKEICDKFTEITKQKLEEVFYKEMIIKDVNNYIGIYTDSSKEPKKKGLFETNYNWKGKQAIFYHKNPSFNIVACALEQYFLNGVDYKSFIENHEDIYDFLGAVKKKSNFDLCLYYIEDGTVKKEYGQKVTRFYVAKKGKKFYKDYKDGRRISILSDWHVEMANHLTQEKIEDIRRNINYSFYIMEVEKVIGEIEEQVTQLKLF